MARLRSKEGRQMLRKPVMEKVFDVLAERDQHHAELQGP
jgi:hypothetical protein